MTYMRRPPTIIAACILILAPFLSVTTVNAQQGENRHVRIFNRASSAIYNLYASNVDRGTWEEDVLGDKTILSGGSILVNIDDGSGHCLYDLKAVLADGRTAVRRKFNVCTQSSWTVTN